jgi:hypothetical protein
LWTKSIGEAPASLGASAKHCVVARRDDKGEGYARHDLVFADERGEPLHADAVSKQWQRATAQVNAAWMAEAKAGGTEPTLLPVDAPLRRAAYLRYFALGSRGAHAGGAGRKS